MTEGLSQAEALGNFALDLSFDVLDRFCLDGRLGVAEVAAEFVFDVERGTEKAEVVHAVHHEVFLRNRITLSTLLLFLHYVF